jgi:uncharacterized protein YjiS (DUF1127 family)
VRSSSQSLASVASAQSIRHADAIDRTHVVACLCRSAAGACKLLKVWRRRYRERRELRSLDWRDVADFCPKLTEAEQESRKPFWRA